MREFDQQLLRLKQALGLVEDQAIAEALGLSKAAFADRKRRNAFPVDKLKALATDKPALRLDTYFILHGATAEQRLALVENRLDVLKETTKAAHELATDPRKVELIRDVLFGARMNAPAIVETAIEHYATVRASSSVAAKSAAQVEQNFAASVGQVAGNNIINRGGKKR